jgi:DNA processing protein
LPKEFGSPDEVFRAPLRRLEARNLPAPSAQAIVKKQSFKRAEKDLANLRKVAAARVINWTDPEYPQTLLQIYDRPVMLYSRGNTQILNAPSLSIVGTRKPTLYGSQMAERLGRDLAVPVRLSWKARSTPARSPRRGWRWNLAGKSSVCRGM